MKKYFALLGLLTGSSFGQVKNYADSIRVTYNIPEIAYAVVSADEIIDIQVSGCHKTGIFNDDAKAGINDYFHLGSNTKAITGVIAAYLVENNKIQWNTKFFDLFPELKSISNPAYMDITLSSLLSHRAGIRPYTDGAEFLKIPKYEGTLSEKREQFVKQVLTEEPIINNEPYNYSNAGYSAAALMLEKATGKTWEELVDDILNKKLNLKYSFGWPNKLSDKQPWGHVEENGTLTALPGDIDYDLKLIEPAGDISMPLPDYAKFIQLNLQGLQGKKNILNVQTYQYLHFGIDHYAIGWGNTVSTGKYLSEHAGSAGTYFAYTLIDKVKNRAYIIIVNSGTPEAQKGVFKLLDHLVKNN